ncbi:MAG: type I pullulanase [Clostridiales bacterium]|nr:type I pullulanase [Clostridiales bacterium]
MYIQKCSLINFTTISVLIGDFSQFDYNNFIVKNGDISINPENVTINNNQVLINLKNAIDIKKETTVFYNDLSAKVSYFSFYSSEEFHNTYYTNKELGAIYTKDHTIFRLWSPVASFVNLLIYENGDPSVEGEVKKFTMVEDKGLWEIKIDGDLKGSFYTYEINVFGETNEVVDPYAKACGINGLRGAIVNLRETTPDNFYSYKGPNFEHYNDAIIYEANIRDISVHPDSGIAHKGKYLGLAEENTKSPKGVSTGLSHILELGVTHVQLMPIFDYSYLSVDERHPYKYNWGYDPQNYNIPEGSYSTDPYNPTIRIRELKELIKTLHKHGLGVIMDVVYNHVFHHETSNFEKIFPGYYFRQYDDGSISQGTGCGNDTASERSMVRKFIIDSVMYWAKEYNLDGFRFDLMGIHDIETMKQIYENLKSLGRKFIVYGEGWYLNTNLRDDQKANIYNSFQLKNIGFFNDKIRDAVKGSVFNIHERGFVSDNESTVDTIKFCAAGCALNIFGKPATFYSPEQNINYSSCHDNYTLWDKLKLSCPDASEEELKNMSKLADGIVLTSIGVPFIHAGAEFCRTKGGIENSYNSADTINRMDWYEKANFLDVMEYYKGLIKLRKEHKAFRMYDREQVANHLKFLPGARSCVAFILENHANGDTWKDIVVIYNGANHCNSVSIPEGSWNVVVNKNSAGTDIIETIEGSNVAVESTSMMVLYR